MMIYFLSAILALGGAAYIFNYQKEVYAHLDDSKKVLEMVKEIHFAVVKKRE